MRRIAHMLLVLALSLSIGLHWACLQSAAWMNMVVTYSRDASFTEAMQKTFDGQHPCERCNAIQKAQDTEKKHTAQVMDCKVELFHETVPCWNAPPLEFQLQEVFENHPMTRPEQPAVPPPRVA